MSNFYTLKLVKQYKLKCKQRNLDINKGTEISYKTDVYNKQNTNPNLNI